MKQLITIAACVLAASGMTNRCAAGTDDALTVKTKMGRFMAKPSTPETDTLRPRYEFLEKGLPPMHF